MWYTTYWDTINYFQMINLDYPELLQLEFILEQTKGKMFMGGEIRRHASITQKVKDELYKRDIGYDQ